MNEHENLVTEQVAENVEQTTEETPVKTYTQEEVDAIVGKKIARTKAKVEKEYSRRYGALTDVLEAGTGTTGVKELTEMFSDYYESRGVKVRKDTEYSSRDIETLAKADAEDIIRGGYDEVVEEVDRLAEIGVENMTAREKALFSALATHRQGAERGRKLSAIGVTEDVYESDDFKAFARKFTSDTPIEDVYDIYSKTQPKKDIKPMGSMKNTGNDSGGVKEFYTVEEARKIPRAELDKNPALFDAVVKSMQKWKK